MNNYQALELALKSTREWLDGLDTSSVCATETLENLRAKIALELNTEGIEPEEVISDLVEATKGGLLGSAGGRFYAWVIGGSLQSALAADWLTSAWDQNAALYACSPATSIIEEVAGEWIKELLDLPQNASFAFTTGCQLAHFTCLASARVSVLKKAGWDVNQNGLFNAPHISIIINEHRHLSIDRAVRYLGFGNRSLVPLETDENGKVLPKILEQALDYCDGNPLIVVLNAADLNTGSFDSFEELIPIAKSQDAWVHVDGAFGLFARASKARYHLTKGLEDADSWATDGHKWLNVPFDCGIAIVRNEESHREAMTISASYIAADTNARDQINWNPEWSRRARSISIYAALRELGKKGVEDLVERCCRYCQMLVTEIGKLPGVEILWQPQLNQGLVRFKSSKKEATNADHDFETDKIIAAINVSGEAFFSGTTWRGVRAMRVSVVNWQTCENDVLRTINAVKKIVLSRQ